MITICSVVGARPQLIKEAVIQKELKKHNDVSHVLIHTGQHYDFNMSGVFFETMNIMPPDYFLGISGVNAVEAIALMMVELEKVFMKVKPDLCIVYGDTNSTLAAAIVANKMSIKLAHIEAGLRQEPKTMPEESNRVITDHLSDLLFCPTKSSFHVLQGESPKGRILLSGDITYDLFLQNKALIDQSIIKKLGLVRNEYIYMTLHRDFNVDFEENLSCILKAVKELNKKCKLVLPIHPRTNKKVIEFGLADYLKDFIVISPVSYHESLALIDGSKFIITDSGGLQKDCYYLKKRAFILMPDTGWRELISSGFHQLLNLDNLVFEFTKNISLDDLEDYFGDGKASKRIVLDILNELKI